MTTLECRLKMSDMLVCGGQLNQIHKWQWTQWTGFRLRHRMQLPLPPCAFHGLYSAFHGLYSLHWLHRWLQLQQHSSSWLWLRLWIQKFDRRRGFRRLRCFASPLSIVSHRSEQLGWIHGVSLSSDSNCRHFDLNLAWPHKKLRGSWIMIIAVASQHHSIIIIIIIFIIFIIRSIIITSCVCVCFMFSSVKVFLSLFLILIYQKNEWTTTGLQGSSLLIKPNN